MGEEAVQLAHAVGYYSAGKERVKERGLYDRRLVQVRWNLWSIRNATFIFWK